MPDNEPIVWSQLTPHQRNALVAQHVFGRKVVAWKADRDMLMRRMNAEGHENIPHYSESMDAAWKIVEKLNEKFDICIHAESAFLCKYSVWLGPTWTGRGNVVKTRYANSGTSMPETICIAALRAQGLTIEIEEKQ